MATDYRLPHGRKFERRIMLIGRLWNQIPFYFGGTPVEEKESIEKDYPNWKKGRGYQALIWGARRSLRSPFNHYVEGSFKDGIWSGVVSRSERKAQSLIDYGKIIDKITDSTLAREEKAAPSHEEITTTLTEAKERGQEEFNRVFDELSARMPRGRDDIRNSLYRKVDGYLRRRYESLEKTDPFWQL